MREINEIAWIHGCANRPSSKAPSNNSGRLLFEQCKAVKSGWDRLDSVFSGKHETRPMAQPESLFTAGRKNNIVARFYGSGIFNVIEPAGRRYCR